MKPPTPMIDRALELVSYDAGCWRWNGAKDPNGYGRLYNPAGTSLAHRAIYEEVHGPLDAGMSLDHLCRNPSCCNPAHLEPVPQAENVRRGRKPPAPTHCPRGHEYTPENLRNRGKGAECKACHREACRMRMRRRRAI